MQANMKKDLQPYLQVLTKAGQSTLSKIFTLAVAGVSGYIAASSLEAATITPSSDAVFLGVVVGAGTYVGARIGPTLGALTGLVAGGVAGGAAGAGLGFIFARDKLKGAATGALIGGAGLGICMMFAGAVGGYVGGVYGGHKLTKQLSLDHIFTRTTATQPVEKQLRAPAPVIRAPAPVLTQ